MNDRSSTIGDPAGVVGRVARRAVHLRCAAQASRRPGPGRRHGGGWPRSADPASSGAQVGRTDLLPGLGSHRRRGRRRRPGRCRAAPRSTSRRRCRRCASSIARSASARTSIPSMPSVPLISASPSLARSASGSTPAARQAVAPSTTVPSRSARLALAEQHQRRRGQRGEVAAGPERPVLAHDRGDARVEQRQHRLDDHGTGAREAHGQAAGAQQHHRPHDLALDLGAHAGGVGADQRQSAARPTVRRG